MKIVVANTVGRLENGQHVSPFPSRWDSVMSSKSTVFYPYELGYLTALLKRELPGADVVMVDGNWEQLGWQEYTERLRPLAPDVLITECSALTYPAMTRVMQGLDLERSILTGPYAMHNPQSAFNDGWSSVVIGEYEGFVLSSLKGDKEETPQDQIKYIDLDWLPWPEDDDVSRIWYQEPYGNPKPGMVQVYPTRGCPLACKFCVVPMYYGGHGNSHKSHRCRNVDDVADEIQYLADKYEGKFNGCYFHEETHNANPAWLASFAEKLIERGLNKYTYDAMCGYWTFTEDLIALLARAGYKNIRMGIESLDTGVGKKIGKVIFEDKLIKVLEWCKKYGIRTYGTSMVGAQGSTAEKDIATLNGLWDLKRRGLLDIWQHSVATPQPGTPFYEEARAGGYLITEDIREFNGVQAVVSWPNYPASEINRVKRLYESGHPSH